MITVVIPIIFQLLLIYFWIISSQFPSEYFVPNVIQAIKIFYFAGFFAEATINTFLDLWLRLFPVAIIGTQIKGNA